MTQAHKEIRARSYIFSFSASTLFILLVIGISHFLNRSGMQINRMPTLFLIILLVPLFFLFYFGYKLLGDPQYSNAFLLFTGLLWVVFAWWFLPVDFSVVSMLSSIVSMAAAGILAMASNYGVIEESILPTPEIIHEIEYYHRDVVSKIQTESWGKRLSRKSLALIGMIIFLPVFVLIIVFIWIWFPGPIIFVKQSVGLGGRLFGVYKFRTMSTNYELESEIVMSKDEYPDTVFIGKILRKTALDELPQLVNILVGEMAFIGPRPLRSILVHKILTTLPAFAHRHQALPGIGGFAQVMGSSNVPASEKLENDLFYIRNRNLWFDFRIFLTALTLTFILRWLPNNTGWIPRSWIVPRNHF